MKTKKKKKRSKKKRKKKERKRGIDVTVDDVRTYYSPCSFDT